MRNNKQKVADAIEVIGASENNLKGISLEIPKNKIVTFCGVSGSGKSSLVFETLANESERQWQASYSQYIRNKMPHYRRPKVDQIKNLTPAIVISQKSMGGNKKSTVGTIVDVAPVLRLLFSRIGVPSAGGSMAYSFNHPAGACPACKGLGKSVQLAVETLFDADKSINDGAIQFSPFAAGWQNYLYANNPLLDADKPLEQFSDKEWTILKYGTGSDVKVEIRSNNTGRVDHVAYEGVVPRFKRLYLNRDTSKLKTALQQEIATHIITGPCRVCSGTGLNPQALSSKINGVNIVDMMEIPVTTLLVRLKGITSQVGQSLVKQMTQTLQQMVEIGLGYLSLRRATNTLSGGEKQRLKIIKNLGGSLNNITYIFDEPTAGLHPFDIDKISKLLRRIRDAHNNVLVVEHAQQIINISDHLIEMGPSAGEKGGEIVYQGDLAGLKAADTRTGRYLKKILTIKKRPRSWWESYHLENITLHNLNDVTVTIPKGVMTAVTGVAGSGKSSLIREAFMARYPAAILINQKAIGTSSRSTPATYSGVMDEIRKVFGKANHVTPSWFSFNAKGACPVCKGTGKIKYDMAFADSVEVTCEECQGERYNPTALGYLYKEKNIRDVLAMTIDQAINFFTEPKIIAPLQKLQEVGLGYMTLGQPTSELSGGENQRLKIAAELNKTGNTYVFDEPSAGLHPDNIEMLLSLFNRLVANHNTVIIIEHRMQLISQADWIIDIGPGGGDHGGQVVFSGTPAEILSASESVTGKYLKKAVNHEQ